MSKNILKAVVREMIVEGAEVLADGVEEVIESNLNHVLDASLYLVKFWTKVTRLSVNLEKQVWVSEGTKAKFKVLGKQLATEVEKIVASRPDLVEAVSELQQVSEEETFFRGRQTKAKAKFKSKAKAEAEAKA